MNYDSNEDAYPTGYGQSFDYRRDLKRRVHAIFGLKRYIPPLDYEHIKLGDQLENWVKATNYGLMTENPSIKRNEESGTGGTYFFYKSGGRISVFKPFDEEPMAPNNPRGTEPANSSTGPLEGTKVGKGAAREVAAYLLDHPTKDKRRRGFCDEDVRGFAGVPPTVPVYCVDKDLNYPSGGQVSYDKVGYYKFGSLQMYEEHVGNCHNKDPKDFSEEEVQKICLLDLRFSNADRHPGNLLYNGANKLIPIDHGYCFPENFKTRIFCWLKWDKSQAQFKPHFEDYIKALDSNQDIKLLIANNFTISYKFARTLHISTKLLQKGVREKLTPFEMGYIMCPIPFDEDDVIDKTVLEATKKLLGEKFCEQSIIEMIIYEATEKLARARMGDQESVAAAGIIMKAMNESKLEGIHMTKAAFEEELLRYIDETMEDKIKEYVEELQLQRRR